MTPQELKNSILQLAIQGRLVEQRPEEGTAEELYQQIIPKQRGLTSGKSELDLSSMDFDIPDSWSFVEFNSLFDFVDYRGKTPHKITRGVFLITASNIRKGFMDYTRKEYISYDEYLERQSRGITSKGDLLFTTEAPMGNAALCDLDECSCGQRIITFQPFYDSTIIPALYMYFILSPQFQKQLSDNCTGTTAKGIKADKLKHFLIPLLPLAEQKRIVAKIEELLPYIDRYEKAWSRLEDFNKRFPTDMQKSILQLAIQGKLVPQRPEEGTGEALYQQIQAEKQSLIRSGKIKKEKPLPEITPDEIPFDIPESWKWVRLESISGKIVDCPHSTPKYYENDTGFSAIDTNCIDSTGTIRRWRYVDESTYNLRIQRLEPTSNDIVYTREGSICRAAVLPDNKKICLGQRVMLIRFPVDIDIGYMKMFLMAPQTVQELTAKQKGIGAKHVNVADVCHLPIPLPPLAEQKRIVAKLEELLPLCERLK